MEKIYTERLVLRKLRQKDALDVARLTWDPWTEYWSGFHYVNTKDEAEEFIKGTRIASSYNDDESTCDEYGITLPGDDRVIGLMNVRTRRVCNNLRTAVLGYLLRCDRTCNGYMTEAVKAVCRELFENRDICQIRLNILPGNEASQRVAEKCGFQKIKDMPLRQREWWGEQDLEAWLLDRYDWRSRELAYELAV